MRFFLSNAKFVATEIDCALDESEKITLQNIPIDISSEKKM